MVKPILELKVDTAIGHWELCSVAYAKRLSNHCVAFCKTLGNTTEAVAQEKCDRMSHLLLLVGVLA